MEGTIKKTLQNGKTVVLREPETLGNRVSDHVALVLDDGHTYKGTIDEIKRGRIWLIQLNELGEIGLPYRCLIGWFYDDREKIHHLQGDSRRAAVPRLEAHGNLLRQGLWD